MRQNLQSDVAPNGSVYFCHEALPGRFGEWDVTDGLNSRLRRSGAGRSLLIFRGGAMPRSRICDAALEQ